MVETAIDKLSQEQQKKLNPLNYEISDPTQQESPSDIQVTVTPTTLDTSSPSDDTTIQVYYFTYYKYYKFDTSNKRKIIT